MKYAVLGGGGLGGLVGGALARTGQPVTLIVRSDHPTRLEIDSRVIGRFSVDVAVTRRLEQPVDLLWITVKAGQLEEALAEAPAAAAPDALVVPLLNGIDHMDVLRAAYGAERVAAGAIRVESERVAPGRIVQPGPFAEIELAGPAAHRARLEGLRRELVATGLGCRIGEDMDVVLWSKLAVIAPFALCSSAAGRPLGGLRADPIWRQRVIDCSAEVLAVAQAIGVAVPRGFESTLDSAPGDMRSSMQKDLAAGRPLELDAIAGPVLRRGAAAGVPVPVTEELVELVRERAG